MRPLCYTGHPLLEDPAGRARVQVGGVQSNVEALLLSRSVPQDVSVKELVHSSRQGKLTVNADSYVAPLSVLQGSDRHARASSAPQQTVSWSSARQANAQARDFTVNALMLDPFSLLIYDYAGGVKDCAKRVLRSIGSPAESLAQDPARILRAVRHAARCGRLCPPPLLQIVRGDLQIAGLSYTCWRNSQDRAGWRAAIECLLQGT